MIRALLIAGLALGTIAACDTNDGPMEEAGEEVTQNERANDALVSSETVAVR